MVKFYVLNQNDDVVSEWNSYDDAETHAAELNAQAALDQYFGVWWDEDEEEVEETGNEWWELDDDAQEAAEQNYRGLTTY